MQVTHFYHRISFICVFLCAHDCIWYYYITFWANKNKLFLIFDLIQILFAKHDTIITPNTLMKSCQTQQ